MTDGPAQPSEFRLPELGENISQGDLVRLMISPGTKVSEGQPVMELETDKAVVEVPSSVSGVVKEVAGKGRREDQSWPGDFHAAKAERRTAQTTRRTDAPSRTRLGTTRSAARFSGRHSRRRQDRRSRRCRPISRSRSRPSFSHARATGQGGRRGASRAGSGGASCAPTGARNRRGYLRR